MIAVSHPGKIGDALWALPTVRALCAKHECRADFYTSEYCEPMRSLMEAQSCIRKMVVPPDYVVRSMDCGVQPWEMPIRGDYTAVYQLGFRGCPSGVLGEHIARSAGLQASVGADVRYDLPATHPLGVRFPDPEKGFFDVDRAYIVSAPRGDTTYTDRFREFYDLCPLPVVEVGALGQAIKAGLDMCGCSMLEMAQLIQHSCGFVGLMSGPLVIAHGFPVRKVVPHNGRSWDMSHVPYSALHHYLVEPTAREMVLAMGLLPNK